MADDQNSILNSANKILNDIIAPFGQSAAGVYSSIIGAKTAADLAKLQQVDNGLTPTTSAQLSTLMAQRGQTVVSVIAYAGIALAVVGAGVLLWKSVK